LNGETLIFGKNSLKLGLQGNFCKIGAALMNALVAWIEGHPVVGGIIVAVIALIGVVWAALIGRGKKKKK
jgi:hypothetical protein